ncbi:helix-turn-helix transcriptional regulator [Lutispora thermophila]|uniref:DNA-binding transcriptional regulator, XRE-family HTH domain n=1 Tax=Lutispora thermophila DSM 19022 TaxID=1122184 RepID=A0A1M6G1N0_9FIRM|nr:helix-turn-helix domain-containing protein [Lutispora thermophila]SHJ03830.1 DNA-binding transcriptional regulator, XRE-family HTH domain [Lutispora thermophila DSM 19022]
MGVKCELRNIRLLEYKMDSKTEFANMLGVEVHTYLKWEKGSTPTLPKALEVAKKLNKKVEDIWHLE